MKKNEEERGGEEERRENEEEEGRNKGKGKREGRRKGGENSVKQGREKLEPRWKDRKNREIRVGKTGSWKKRRLIWAYFFATYLNYLKGELHAKAGYGFPLVPLETEGSLPFRWKYCVCIYTGM